MSKPFKQSYLLPSPSQISELRGVIRSHSPPSATLLARSHSVLDNSPVELARYATEIRMLEEALAELKSERALLESHVDDCRSLFSPVRRLPTELLVEIFDLCSPDFNSVDDTTTVDQEEDRLAKIYLLRISRVCSRWHDIVMNSPKLWSTITVDTTLWRKSTSSSATLLALLVSSLKRGADFPLTLEAAIGRKHPNHKSVLKLLAQHSRRWQTAYLWVDPEHLTFLAHAQENLPVLESLTLLSARRANVEATAEVFAAIPRLKTAEISGWFDGVSPQLPWGQLRQLTIANGLCRMLSLDMLPLLSAEARCTIVVYAATLDLPLHLSTAASNIPSLRIGFSTEHNKLDETTYLTRTSEVLGEIFAGLSLPRLGHLSIFCKYGLPPLWDAPRFLDFASRSLLRNTLRLFEVDSIITDIEILESLSVLPLLEELQIRDCANTDEEHITITDHLLHQLTWRPDQANLIPHLRVLRLGTLGKFGEEPFLEFASSRRIVPGHSDARPFTIKISASCDASRQFSQELFDGLYALEDKGGFLFDDSYL